MQSRNRHESAGRYQISEGRCSPVTKITTSAAAPIASLISVCRVRVAALRSWDKVDMGASIYVATLFSFLIKNVKNFLGTSVNKMSTD